MHDHRREHGARLLDNRIEVRSRGGKVRRIVSFKYDLHPARQLILRDKIVNRLVIGAIGVFGAFDVEG